MLWLILALLPLSLGADSDGDGLDDADEVLAHLPPEVADSDGDGLFDHLDSDMDGDGVDNVDECRLGGVSGLALVNGSFEQPDSSGFGVMYPTSIPGWQTTDSAFEVWEYGFEGKSAYDGDQFVEMNAFAVGTLFQDVATAIDDVYIYAFSHRGRFGSDTINFKLGDPSGPLTTVRTVTDGPGEWGRWGGVITTTSLLTRFAYQSVSSACGLSCGNLLDAISFTPACDLDTDLDGDVDALDTDSDDDGVLDGVDACPGMDDATSDPDGDLICGAMDVCPLDSFNDWDEDGYCGDVDLCAGFDDALDMDIDGIPDGCDSDRDGDGFDESTDCNENDAAVGAALTYYPDFDGDGYGQTSGAFTTCAPGVMFVLLSGDCDEASAAVNPAAEETCLDMLDLDCDGVVSYDDADGDYVCGPLDACPGYDDADDLDLDAIPDGCDPDRDGDAVSDVDDCDSSSPFVLGPKTFYLDADTDSFGDPLVSVLSCSHPVGYVIDGSDCNDASANERPFWSETCDGADNDCDGTVDEGTECFDDDGDGLTELAGDCDDGDASQNGPFMAYLDRDADGWGDSEVFEMVCSMPPEHVAQGGDCNDRDEDVYPTAPESCTGGLEDLNCDGSVGFVDADGDRWAACEDCDDANAELNGSTRWYRDADNDGVGRADQFEVGCEELFGYSLLAGDCDDEDPFSFVDCISVVTVTDTVYQTNTLYQTNTVYQTSTVYSTSVVTSTVYQTNTVYETSTVVVEVPVYIEDEATDTLQEVPTYGGGWRCGLTTPDAFEAVLLSAGLIALARRRAA